MKFHRPNHIVGFTRYSLTDQVDWDTALRATSGNINRLGVFDLDWRIRPVGEASRKLMHIWREVLPAQSVCLRMPLVRPSEYGEAGAIKKRAEAEQAEPVDRTASANASRRGRPQ